MTDSATTPARRRRLLKLSLAVGSVVVTLATLEGGSYLFGSFPGPEQPVQGGSIYIYGQHDQELFWSLRPFAESPEGVRWINSDGLRGQEIGPKGDNEYRILNIGESTTFAAQVRYEQCYSAILEDLCNLESREQRVRSLNAGVPGYTIFQGVKFLQSRGLEFKPDMVTLYFGFNDFLSTAYLGDRAGNQSPDEGGLTDRQLFELRSKPWMRCIWMLTKHSNFFRALRRLTEPDSQEGTATKSKRARVPREDRRLMIQEARDFCAQHDITLVIIIPIYRSFTLHQKFLGGLIREYNLIGLDLPTLLPDRFINHRATYFADNVHPNPEGHLLIAKAIHELVSPMIR